MSSSQESEDSLSERSEDQLTLTEEQAQHIDQHGALYIIGTKEMELYKAGLDMQRLTVGHPVYDAHWVGMQADTIDEIIERIEVATERMREEPKSRFILHMPPILEDWPQEREKLGKLHQFMEEWIKGNKDLVNLPYCTIITPWQPDEEDRGLNSEIDPEVDDFKTLVRKAKICCFKTSQVMRVSVPHWNQVGRLHLIFMWLLERYGPGWETTNGDEYGNAKDNPETQKSTGNPNQKGDMDKKLEELKEYVEQYGKEILGGLRHNSKMVAYDTRITLEIWNRLTKFGEDVVCCMVCGSQEHHSNACPRFDYIIDPFVCRKCGYPHTGTQCVENVDRKKKIHKAMHRDLIRFIPKGANGRKPTNTRREESRGDGRQSSTQKRVIPADHQQRGKPMDVDFDNDDRPEAKPSELSQRVTSRWKSKESNPPSGPSREKEKREVVKPKSGGFVVL